MTDSSIAYKDLRGYLAAVAGTVAPLNRAPHPNAAKVLSTGSCYATARSRLKSAPATPRARRPHCASTVRKTKSASRTTPRRDQKFDTGKPEWIEMKPVLGVFNETLKAAVKNCWLTRKILKNYTVR